MAKVVLPHMPELTAAALQEMFAKHFEGTYEVYKTMLLGADFVIKKSSWSGVSVKLIQKKNKTIIRFGGMSPAAWARILANGLIPLLILYFTTWKTMQKEVEAFIKGCEELSGTPAQLPPAGGTTA